MHRRMGQPPGGTHMQPLALTRDVQPAFILMQDVRGGERLFGHFLDWSQLLRTAAKPASVPWLRCTPNRSRSTSQARSHGKRGCSTRETAMAPSLLPYWTGARTSAGNEARAGV